MSDLIEAPEGIAEATTQDGQAEIQEAFFEAPDGTKYASPDELREALTSKYIPQPEWTKKTQGLARERSEFQRQKDEWERQRQENEAKYKRSAEYEQFDKFINQRPDAYRRWRQEIENGATPNDLRSQIKQEIAEEYGSDLKELKTWRQQQEAEAQRKAVYVQMKTKYKDFDEGAMDKMLDDLADGDLSAFTEALYFSGKGRKAPGEIAAEIAGNMEEQQAAGLPGGAPRGIANRSAGKPKTLDDARRLLKAKLHNTS